ncbi:MAG: hypothetical protein PHP50_12315 [Lachnospiraceae bacterium]|nr:hypothetical protein [Lachnospiraceae bacterium]
MILEPMKEAELIDYLKEMEYGKRCLEQNKKNIYHEIETQEESIRRNSFRSVGSDLPAASGHGTIKDKVYKILMQSYRNIERQVEDAAARLLELNEQEEKMQFVRQCIRMLPLNQSSIIESQFIKRQGWEVYAKNYHISKASIYRIRKTALQNLLVIYNYRFQQNNEKKRNQQRTERKEPAV